jgi:hypothetical protein
MTEPRPTPVATDAPDTGHAVDCDVCALFGPPAWHADEADQLAAIHDHLHHRGQPTATVRRC